MNPVQVACCYVFRRIPSTEDKYKGEWEVTKGMITVRYVMETETTQTGSEPYPYTKLAEQLLSNS